MLLLAVVKYRRVNINVFAIKENHYLPHLQQNIDIDVMALQICKSIFVVPLTYHHFNPSQLKCICIYGNQSYFSRLLISRCPILFSGINDIKYKETMLLSNNRLELLPYSTSSSEYARKSNTVTLQNTLLKRDMKSILLLLRIL